MLKNYFLSALRFLLRNGRHVAFNLFGFATGLFIFILASGLQEHERNHDGFFAGAENIFGVFTQVLPQSGFGTSRVHGAAPVIGPLLGINFPAIEASSRFIEVRQSVTYQTDSYSESVKFVDPDFTSVFEFDYLAGSEQALASGTGVIMTREAAQRYFGRVDAVGETIQINGEIDLAVAAVIDNLPSNSHFVYRFGTADRMQIIAPIQVLDRLMGTERLSSWGAVSDVNRLWLKLAPGTDTTQLAVEISGFITGFIGEAGRDIIGGVGLLNLTQWNYLALNANGVPLVAVAVVLASLVLLVAVFNYSNLFTALTVRRLRELAIRKTLGASHYQLSALMLMESVLLTSFAALLAFAAVLILLPAIGQIVSKDIQAVSLLNTNMMAIVLITVSVTSMLAVAFPVYVVNRLSITQSLRGQHLRGRVGTRLRSLLVIIQFSFNAILGTLMATGMLQNQHLLTSDPGFNRDNVVVLSGLKNELVNQRQDTLVSNLLALPSVEAVAGASQHPLQEIHNQLRFSLGSERDSLDTTLYRFSVGEGFFGVYEIDLAAGRNLSQASDAIKADSLGVATNVLLNRSAIRQLGLSDTHAEAVIGETFYSHNEGSPTRAFMIVGVVEDANLLGLSNDIKPSVFLLNSIEFNSLSIKLREGAGEDALSDINRVWVDLFPQVPVQSVFLEQFFQQRFGIFAGINNTLIALSIVSIVLATSGLYGLITLLAHQRQKEIAIRKVFGATFTQLMRFLSVHFTRPVIVGLLLGAPLGLFASVQYLSLFAERIGGVSWIALSVSLLILLLAWLTISEQIFRSARVNPAQHLRSE